MIQRIQSVYFLLAGILPAFTFCIPLAQYLNTENVNVVTLTAYEFSSLSGDSSQIAWGLMLFTVLSIMMSFVCLFCYKSRNKQIVFSNLLLTFILLLGLSFVAYGYSFGSGHNLRFLPYWGSLFPALSFLFVLLARNGVKKDEELVRSAERIR